jgi:hypothetical protein
LSRFLVAYLIHAFRVALAALVTLLAGFLLWVLIGIVGGATGFRSPALVFVFAVAAFAVGGYVSARYITPGSIVHAVIGAAAVAVLCIALWSTGDVSTLYFALPTVAGGIAALGAAVARAVGAPPDNRWRGP